MTEEEQGLGLSRNGGETGAATPKSAATIIFEPHNGYGRKDPDGEPWPFGYISESDGSHAMPVFELSVIVKHEPEKLYALGRLFGAAQELLEEAREICGILDLYRADTGEEPCFDHEAIGEEVARRHDSLTAAIARAIGADQ